ncbi:MAG: peptidylprolyl isomerase [Planctomycetes bacterium]|nr:peptidylprolyl isomerase [Planctomycetota bacterium]
MTQPATIATGKVVSIHYVLTVQGEQIDASPEGEPFEFLAGAGNIVEGLERALLGRLVGESVQVSVSPEQGYGLRDPQGEQEIPRSAFPTDFELEPGMQFGAEDDSGKVVPMWVKTVGAEMLTVDFNHPLAGETLEFQVRVLGIREPTQEERRHGHPHGPHGHQH